MTGTERFTFFLSHSVCFAAPSLLSADQPRGKCPVATHGQQCLCWVTPAQSVPRPVARRWDQSSLTSGQASFHVLAPLLGSSESDPGTWVGGNLSQGVPESSANRAQAWAVPVTPKIHAVGGSHSDSCDGPLPQCLALPRPPPAWGCRWAWGHAAWLHLVKDVPCVCVCVLGRVGVPGCWQRYPKLLLVSSNFEVCSYQGEVSSCWLTCGENTSIPGGLLVWGSEGAGDQAEGGLTRGAGADKATQFRFSETW